MLLSDAFAASFVSFDGSVLLMSCPIDFGSSATGYICVETAAWPL